MTTVQDGSERDKLDKRPGEHCQNEVSNVTKWHDPLRVESARRARLTSRRDGTKERFRCPSRCRAAGAGAALVRRASVTCVLCGAACHEWPPDHRQREKRQATRLAGQTPSRWKGRPLQQRGRRCSREGRPSAPRDLRFLAHVRGGASAEPPLGAGARQHWRGHARANSAAVDSKKREWVNL